MSVPESYKELEGLMEDLYEENESLRARAEAAEKVIETVGQHVASAIENVEGRGLSAKDWMYEVQRIARAAGEGD
jgi:hypothetical protein